MQEFVAIGAETGFSRGVALTGLGMVRFADGVEVESYYAPVEAQMVQEIDHSGVVETDTVPLASAIRLVDSWAAGGWLVCHGPMTKDVVRNSFAITGIRVRAQWMDTAVVVPGVDPRAAHGGLDWMAELYGLPFAHGNAVKVARTVGQVLVAALERNNSRKLATGQSVG